MTRHRGLGRLHGIHQVTYAHLPLTVQQADQAEANIITEAFAELGGREHVRTLYSYIRKYGY